MSRELDYFPPQGSRYKWCNKALNYSPWACNLADQLGPKYHWPMNIHLTVDLFDGHYKWVVQVCDWAGQRNTVQGWEDKPLSALLAAEKCGEEAYGKLMPEWVTTALTNGWRPPFRGVVGP